MKESRADSFRSLVRIFGLKELLCRRFRSTGYVLGGWMLGMGESAACFVLSFVALALARTDSLPCSPLSLSLSRRMVSSPFHSLSFPSLPFPSSPSLPRPPPLAHSLSFSFSFSFPFSNPPQSPPVSLSPSKQEVVSSVPKPPTSPPNVPPNS